MSSCSIDQCRFLCRSVVMKVLLSGIDAKKGYMVIDIFYSVLAGMNYPVKYHDESKIQFVDIDDGFRLTSLRYDFHGKKIILG